MRVKSVIITIALLAVMLTSAEANVTYFWQNKKYINQWTTSTNTSSQYVGYVWKRWDKRAGCYYTLTREVREFVANEVNNDGRSHIIPVQEYIDNTQPVYKTIIHEQDVLGYWHESDFVTTYSYGEIWKFWGPWNMGSVVGGLTPIPQPTPYNSPVNGYCIGCDSVPVIQP